MKQLPSGTHLIHGPELSTSEFFESCPKHAVTFFAPYNPSRPWVAQCVCSADSTWSDPEYRVVEDAWLEHSRAAAEAAA